MATSTFTARHAIKRGLQKYGYAVQRVPKNGPGNDPFEDMRRLTSVARPVIFDVGANSGQTVKQFRQYFGNLPEIHSFEPGAAAFEQLTSTAAGLPNVRLNNAGLGSRRGRKTFIENELSDMSSLLEPGEDAWGAIKERRTIELDTVDDYCERNGIQRIDILKSDTQGYDLEVLRGATRMLRDENVRLVYLEVIFSKMYKGAPRFDETYAFLADSGFSLVSFYAMHYQHDLLSWTDALFIRPT